MSRFNTYSKQDTQTKDIEADTIEVQKLEIVDECIIWNNAQTNFIDLKFDSKGEPGHVYINKNNNHCSFEKVQNLIPEIKHISTDENKPYETYVAGDFHANNVLIDGVNIKTYIDKKFEYILSNIGGQLNSLTAE